MDDHALRSKGDLLLTMTGVTIVAGSGEAQSTLVNNVDLTLARGEVLGIIGESGAGKTTLGIAAMGYTRPGCRITAGTITFDGVDLVSADLGQKKELWGSRIAYVAQSAAASFNPAHRLIDQTIETKLERHGGDRAAASRDAEILFNALSLPNPVDVGRRYPHQVSGGQLQRVMTAMAMTCRPDLIIFDEPTTALDVTTQVEVLASIRAIVETSHCAAIYISHDLAVVAQMADRVMVMRHGQRVEEAGTRQMLSEPKEEYTRTLWAVRNLQKPEQAGDDNILEIKTVSAVYSNAFKVLHDVSVDVPRGRTVAIVGESGSGKTSLARTVVGLLSPSSGRILLDGKPLAANVRARSKEEHRRIQMIHQSPDVALNPRHRVVDILGRPLTFYGETSRSDRDRRILELLEMIELDESYADRLPSELSGGQKQRICIARALAARPDLIVCDEVTSALDQVVQEGILKLLLRLQERYGMSYLFITHDIATVRAISDRVVVMNKGRVVEQGAKSEVLMPPHAPYTDLLLSSVPQMDPDWLTRLLSARQAAARNGTRDEGALVS